MMEWEPIQNTIPNVTNIDIENNYHDNDHDRRLTPVRSNKTNMLPSPTVSDAERRMLHMLLPHDVLLKGRPQLQHLVAGNAEYNDLLDQYHSPFAQLPREQKQEIVQIVMATVWSQGGRFLQHDPLKGTISLLSNEQAEKLIRQDLKQSKRKRNQQEVQIGSNKRGNKRMRQLQSQQQQHQQHQSPKKAMNATKSSHNRKYRKSKRGRASKKGQRGEDVTIHQTVGNPFATATTTTSQPPLSIHPFAIPSATTTNTTKLFGHATNGTRFGDV
jgi:hypothetical protein